MENKVAEAVTDLKQYISHLKENGVSEVQMDPAKLDALGKVPGPTEARPQPEPPAPTASQTDLPTDRNRAIENINARIASCQDCPLWETRTKTVPGEGCLDPDLMFIGEAPGKDEDLQGSPFVGRAGKLLDRLITRMGYTRDEVFIGNICKCRPTENYQMKKDRPPQAEEMEACIHYLKEQILIIRPKVIVALGNTAMEGLFGFRGITKRRGKWLEYEGIPTMPTYHPSYLLRGGGDQGKRFW